MNRTCVVLMFLMSWVCPVFAEDAIKAAFLAGRLDEVKTAAVKRLSTEPGDSVTRALYANSLMRAGQYADAEKVLTNPPADNDLVVIAALADLRDLQGKADEARAIRKKAIDVLSNGKDFSVDELTAGVSALRGIGEYNAANQCLQLAQDKDAEDPFMQLEKIRLYAATNAYAIAAGTAAHLVEAHSDCAMAYAEWAEVLWLAKKDKKAVTGLCQEALTRDATLSGARYRLAYYYVLGDDPATARVLIDDSLRINPNDRKNKLLRESIDSLHFDAANLNPQTADPELNLLLAELFAAKGRDQLALVRARAVLAALPDDSRGMRQAGFALFRTGNLEESRSVLEKVMQRDSFDIEVRNLLTLLDSAFKADTTAAGPITIAYDKRDALSSAYAASLIENAYAEELHRYQIETAPSLRVQVCRARDDLAVATGGIPFGCCADPADPATAGIVSFENVVFMWSPVSVAGQNHVYRWDAALHHAAAQAAVRTATGNHAPQWLREGFAGYAAMRSVHNYTSPYLADTLKNISDPDFALAKMEDGFLDHKRPLYETYAALLAEEWTARYGDEKITALWKLVASGQPWTEALASAFGAPIDTLKTEADAAILKRYEWAITQKESKESATLAQAAIEQGDPTTAAKHAIEALDSAPFDDRNLGLYRRITESLQTQEPKPDVYYTLIAKVCRLDPANADLRFELAEHFEKTGNPEDAIRYCRDALGIRPGWLDAHRVLAQVALANNRPDDAYPSLVVLHTARPEHLKTLEELVRCARALNKEEAPLYAQRLEKLAPGTNPAVPPAQQPSSGS